MSKLVIKKRVDLDFLGAGYEKAYLIFRSVPLSDYDETMAKMPESNDRYIELVLKAQDSGLDDTEVAEFQKLQKAEKENNSQSMNIMLELLKKYFIKGMFPNAETDELEEVTNKEDLDGIDRNLAVECFNRLVGLTRDPKSQPPLETQSSTTPSTVE